MSWLFNFVYLFGIILLSPWLAYKALTTGKYRRGMRKKFLGQVDHPLLDDYHRKFLRIVWFHGVSVGEIHLLRQVVARFRQRRPDCGCVISTTTDTGYDEARKCFADLPVILWPLDFSWAVQRALAYVRPALVVLAEGELWPNFLRAAKRHAIPVAVVNGRMSPRSCGRFRKIRFLASQLFSRLDLVAAQTAEYAENYRALGAVNVHATGSVKYDGAECKRDNGRTQALRRLLGIGSDEVVWIAGSTQAPEEKIVLDIYGRLRLKHPEMRLVLVPRQKDRFEEVAQLLERSRLPYLRRSRISPEGVVSGERAGTTKPMLLIDTIGELGALWGLADIAYVGGSLDGKRGGQNMIEPAAYGAAVLFGPHTWNFKETVAHLLRRQAAWQIAGATELEGAVARLLGDPQGRVQLGLAGREFVMSQQGATERTLVLLDAFLPIAKVQAA
jgi:3-deoxy-D-manno-octulosonic-acid transferase